MPSNDQDAPLPPLPPGGDTDLNDTPDQAQTRTVRSLTDPFNRARLSSSADVDMDAPNRDRVQNAPTLPKAPMYSGRTLQARRKFMREYETYTHALSAYETSTHRPFVMPVSACISMKTKHVIASYEFPGRTLTSIQEQEWINYFLEASVPEYSDDYDEIDEAMKKLKMDTTLRESKSRITKLQADMHDILDELNMEEILPANDPKKLVEYMTAALEPPAFKKVVVSRLKNKSNKQYKHDHVLFCKWIAPLLASHLLWERSQAPVRTPPPPKKDRGGSDTGNGGRFGNGGDRAPSGDRQAPPARPANTGTPRTPQAPAPTGAHPQCLKCQSTEHRVRSCPLVAPGEAADLVEAWRAQRRPQGQRRVEKAASSVTGNEMSAVVDGVTVKTALLDSGADLSLVSAGVIRALEAHGSYVSIASVGKPVELVPVGDQRFVVRRRVKFDNVTLESSAGPLVLRGMICWIHEQDDSMFLTLGRPVMEQLGYSADGLLAAARQLRGEQVELGAAAATPVSTAATRMRRVRESVCYGQPEPDDHLVSTPALTKPAADKVLVSLEKRLAEASANGLGQANSQQLWELLVEYADVFRLSFGSDPPVDIEPLRVRLREGAQPIKCKNRRYPAAHQAYLEEHIKELEDAGLMTPNHRSRWASPPRVVPKKEPNQYRMTVDLRAVNAVTEPMPWPMPDLESAMGKVERARHFFNVDWFRGYWQLPLHPDSQEMYSIMTHRGVWTPTRVMMGQTDAVAYCQGAVDTIFGDMLYEDLLAWLDDALGYSETQEGLMVTLERLLARCREYGLKLHPDKCCFYDVQAKWCGKIISAAGVAHCPERVAGLVDMQTPTNAGELQQFLCAVNWMRANIPEYAEKTSVLYKVLEDAMKVAQSRKKKNCSRWL